MNQPVADPVPELTAALSGRFEAGGLLDLVEALHRAQVTGALRIEAPGVGDGAALDLHGGEVRAAFCAGYSGMQALPRLLLCGPGSVRVDPMSPVYTANIGGPTAELLRKIRGVLAEVDHERLFGRADAEQPEARPGEPDTTSLTADDLASALGEAPVDDPGMTMRLATLNTPQPGALLGRYVLGEELGHGASSVVFKARHTALDAEVVVKVLIPAAMRGATSAAMTLNEARVLARLSHPHILRVFDYDDRASFPHLVVEYVAGTNLQAMIKQRGRIETTRALELLHQVAKGLAYAHHRVGLVHGDLKPGNILIADDGQAKLADFGIATMTALEQGIGSPTATAALKRQVKGTPAYVAPELVQGLGDGDARSDMYSLGATFYHALAGRPPYDDPDPVKLMLHHTSGGCVPLDVAAPGIDEATAALIARLMALRPQDRFQTWGEAVADIEALRKGNARRSSTSWKQLVGRVWNRTG